MRIAVASGKGGTGKTTITAALAESSRGAVLADCDVDAPDLHLFLQPTPQGQQPFHGLQLARIDEPECTAGTWSSSTARLLVKRGGGPVGSDCCTSHMRLVTSRGLRPRPRLR